MTVDHFHLEKKGLYLHEHFLSIIHSKKWPSCTTYVHTHTNKPHIMHTNNNKSRGPVGSEEVFVLDNQALFYHITKKGWVGWEEWIGRGRHVSITAGVEEMDC